MFTRVFYYPRPLCGLPDVAISATDRDGRSTIGSSSYVLSDSSAAELAEDVEFYIANGGNPKYSLRDPKRFPKAITALYFPLRTRVAGLWTMRVGNVSGPDKNYTKGFEYLVGHDTSLAWKWTRDPRFAYIIRQYGKRSEWTEAEWAEIEKAAAESGLKRAPWMDNRSRVLPATWPSWSPVCSTTIGGSAAPPRSGSARALATRTTTRSTCRCTPSACP